MKILALELSSGQGSIAWMENETPLLVAEFPNDRKHSGLFFDNLDRSVARFGAADRIVVGLGPGSYAGTRIAIAAAIGLQVASGAELLGLPSVCAFPVAENEYGVIGDARRDAFFFARISGRRCLEGPTLMTRDELVRQLESATFPIVAAETLDHFPEAKLRYPAAKILAEIAFHSPRTMTAAPLEPLYLREPHITPPKVTK